MLSKLLKKKKIFTFATKGVLAIVLFAIFFAPLQGFAPVVRAEPVNTPAGQAVANFAASNPGATTAQLGQANADATAAVNAATAANPNATPAQLAQAATNGTGNTQADSLGCSVFNGNGIAMCLSNVVYVFTVGLMSILAYIGAFIFDIAVQITLQSVTYSQAFLTTSWAAVRDLANMAFIFLLVYLAVTIVLRAETSDALKMLAGVIIAALLINFSFFITRVVIDGGNILATQFYNAINAPPLSASGQGTGGVVGSIQTAANVISPNNNVKDLTSGIMNVIGVQKFVGSQSFSAFSKQLGSGLGVLITLCFIYIAVGAILAMLAFTFIAVGVKFLVRIVALWFVIISAPLAFVAAAIFKKNTPDRFNLFKRWQEALIQFAFYPAVFLFIFWIINLFASQLGTADGGILGASFTDAGAVVARGAIYTIATVIASVTIRLGIVVIMLYLATIASDKIAKGTNNLAHSASAWTGNKFLGYTGKFGQKTMGAASYYLGAKVQGTTPGMIRGTLARPFNALGRASFDYRGAPGFNKSMDVVTKTELGKPGAVTRRPIQNTPRQNPNPQPPNPPRGGGGGGGQNPPQQPAAPAAQAVAVAPVNNAANDNNQQGGVRRAANDNTVQAGAGVAANDNTPNTQPETTTTPVIANSNPSPTQGGSGIIQDRNQAGIPIGPRVAAAPEGHGGYVSPASTPLTDSKTSQRLEELRTAMKEVNSTIEKASGTSDAVLEETQSRQGGLLRKLIKGDEKQTKRMGEGIDSIKAEIAETRHTLPESRPIEVHVEQSAPTIPLPLRPKNDAAPTLPPRPIAPPEKPLPPSSGPSLPPQK